MKKRGRYLLFRVGGRMYAAPAEELRGMVRASGACVEVEGEEVAVVAPHEALEGCAPLAGPRTCVLLFAGPGGERVGMLVDSVSRIEEMDERRVRHESSGLFRAKVLVGEKWVGVLDVGRITGGG